jgi:hypothetical protein
VKLVQQFYALYRLPKPAVAKPTARIMVPSRPR